VKAKGTKAKVHCSVSKQGATIIMDKTTDGKASSRYVQVI